MSTFGHAQLLSARQSTARLDLFLKVDLHGCAESQPNDAAKDAPPTDDDQGASSMPGASIRVLE